MLRIFDIGYRQNFLISLIIINAHQVISELGKGLALVVK